MRFSQHFRIGLVGLVISVLALVFVINQINVDQFWQALLSARYEYLLPCILFLLLGLVTRALRWQVLLQGQVPLRRAFSIMNVAYLVNGILPLRMGELGRIYLLTRLPEPVAAPKATATIIVERLLDLLAVLGLMVIALATGPLPSEIQTAGIAAGLMMALGFVLLFIMVTQRALANRVLDALLSRFTLLARLPLKDWLNQFLDGLRPIQQGAAFSQALLWTAISWLFSVIAGYWLMFAFFEQASWATTALFIAAAAFSIAVPAVPGNIGPYEASILLALSAMGYEQGGSAVAFALTVHAVNVLVHASTGIIGFVQEGVSLGQLSRGVQQMRQSPKAG